MPRAKRRTPELAARVLRCALELIDSEGLRALTARRLAADAQTSPAAIYELFGDKAGVIRAMFFAGFELLGESLGEADGDADPLEALLELAQRYRAFILARPALSALMFSRPFASFDPAPEESAAGAAVRQRIVAAVEDAVNAGRVDGDPVDIAHAYVALVHGLAAAEASDRLGRSEQTVQRRWDLGVRALLAGWG
jgi:AcrR family transcriptional regulator